MVYPDGSDGVFQFNPKDYEDDIGIVHLSSPVAVAPASLYSTQPSWTDILNQHMSMLFVGFGFNVIGGDMVGLGVKREGEWEIDRVNNRTIEFQVPGSNTCYGDSGGPAFVENVSGTALLLAAVTSGGSSDCTQGIETRIDAYQSWLNGKII